MGCVALLLQSQRPIKYKPKVTSKLPTNPTFWMPITIMLEIMHTYKLPRLIVSNMMFLKLFIDPFHSVFLELLTAQCL